MKTTIKIEIEVNGARENYCSRSCEYNDSDQFCQLFSTELGSDGERCDSCKEAEQK